MDDKRGEIEGTHEINEKQARDKPARQTHVSTDTQKSSAQPMGSTIEQTLQGDFKQRAALAENPHGNTENLKRSGATFVDNADDLLAPTGLVRTCNLQLPQSTTWRIHTRRR
jgi:hypothetical protein